MSTMEKTKQLVKSNNNRTMDLRSMIIASTKELGKALPSHMNPERLVRIALTTLRLTPKLYDCNPQSFLGALFQCSALGLEPNVEGQAYIIPYGREAQFQIGYKGLIELFYRHSLAVSLDVHEVRANDLLDYEYGTAAFLKHIPTDEDRGEIVKYYAIAKMKDGGVIFKVMSEDACIKHGKKHSKCYSSSSSPWQKEPGAMCKKTVLIQLMKLLPKSIEIQKALAMDSTTKSKIKADMFEVPDETDWEEDQDPTESNEGTPVDTDFDPFEKGGK